MILCEATNIVNIATLITALSALITGFYLWYDRRARIIISIEPCDRVYFITFENVGKSVAKDVKISIDKDFISSLPVYDDEQGGRIKQILFNIQNRKFYFPPGTKKYYYLIQCPKTNEPLSRFDIMCNQWYKENKYTPFRINVQYNSWFDSSVEFSLDQFNSEALLYKDSTAKISDTLKQLQKEQKKYRETIMPLLKNIYKYINGKTENEDS